MIDLKKQTTFCVIPWLHLSARPDGTLNYCSLAPDHILQDESGQAYRLDNTEVDTIWNSKSLRNIRKKMLAGESVKSCQACYDEEDVNKRSCRQWNNERWTNMLGTVEISTRAEEGLSTDGFTSSPPVYLDVRAGNKCNLKCRMCSPIHSQSLNEEFHNLMNHEPSLSDYFKKK